MVLTEERIRDIALLFLRQHYKFWPREGDLHIRRHLRADGGVVADGLISFTQKDHRIFTAAVEASDYLNRDELWYKPLWQLAFWDAGALASLSASAILVLLHLDGRLGLMHDSPLLFALLFLGGAVLMTIAVFMGIRSWRRYRYVYAVEQFKRYAASEQWIAFSWDVFPGPEDRFFTELKTQCILNGYGLLEILSDESVKMHLTPARQGDPGTDKRRVLRFFTDSEWSQRVRETIRGEGWREQLGDFFERLTGKPALNDLIRFKRPIWRQIGVGFLATTLIAIVLYREYGKRPILYVDEDAYAERMERIAQALRNAPEPVFIPFPPDTVSTVPFSKKVQPYLPNILPDTSSIWGEMQEKGYIRVGEKGVTVYPCAYAQSLLYRRYAVHIGAFYEIEYAQKALWEVRKKGVAAHVLFLGCFEPRKAYYVLVLEETFNELEQANQGAAKLRQSIPGQLTEFFPRVDYFY